MGDTDIGDEFDDYFYDGDYLYIEDDIFVADELAESQIPSPGYTGTNAELSYESYEYDPYDYFGDVEYADDPYWDVSHGTKKQDDTTKRVAERGGRKRKRASTLTSTRIDKRQKVHEHDWEDSTSRNVIFRATLTPPRTPELAPNAPDFALLPDWRVRFPANAEVSWRKSMPEDMKQAAEATENGNDGDEEPEATVVRTIIADVQPQSQGSRRKKAKATRKAQSDINEDDDAQDLLRSLNSDTLRAMLRSRLGDTNMDEEVFMSVISQMLSGGGSADEAAAQLAGALLDQDCDTSEATLDWLQGQGVNIKAPGDSVYEAKDQRTDSGAGLAIVATSEEADMKENSRHGRARPNRTRVGKSNVSARPEQPQTSRNQNKK